MNPRTIAAFKAALVQLCTKSGSAPHPQPDRVEMVRALSRSTTIVGKMLDGMEKDRETGTKVGAFVMRLGRILWGVVEAAVPHSTGRLLMKYWFSLLLMFETVLIVGGFLLPAPGAQTFGLKLLFLTLLYGAIVEFLRMYFEEKRVGRVAAVALALLVLLALLAVLVVVLNPGGAVERWKLLATYRTALLPGAEHRLAAGVIAGAAAIVVLWLTNRVLNGAGRRA